MKEKRPIAFFVNERGCHVCTSHKPIKSGYPKYSYKGVQTQMHRALYQEKHGDLPSTVVVRHVCDNRLCINLDHLVEGSIGDNNRDTVERGRWSRSGLNWGSEKGEKNYRSRLKEEQVREILASKDNNVQLGKRYGVTHQCIWRIRKGLSWSHLSMGMSDKG